MVSGWVSGIGDGIKEIILV